MRKENTVFLNNGELRALYEIRCIIDPDKPERKMQDELVDAIRQLKTEQDQLRRMIKSACEIIECVGTSACGCSDSDMCRKALVWMEIAPPQETGEEPTP